MWTKRRNREGKRRKEWKKEQRRREDRKEEKANETKERIPRAVFPEAFVCFVFSLVVKWNYCSINRHSPFLLPPFLCGRRTNIQASLAPSLFRLLPVSLFLSSRPSTPSSSSTDLFALANVRTRSRVSRQVRKEENQALLLLPLSLLLHCTHPRRLLGYLRFLQRLRTEFSSSSSCLILALSVLQSLSCPPRISLPPCRQIKFLEERRKDHLPFFRPSGNLKPVPLYQKKLLPSPPTAATTTITTTLLQDPIAPSVFQPILALLALAITRE